MSERETWPIQRIPGLQIERINIAGADDIDLSGLPEPFRSEAATINRICVKMPVSRHDLLLPFRALALVLGAMRAVLAAYNALLDAQRRILTGIAAHEPENDVAVKEQLQAAHEASIQLREEMTTLRDTLRQIEEMGDE